MNKLSTWVCLIILFFPLTILAWSPPWLSSDQKAIKLLQTGEAKEAAKIFHNKNWQAVAFYRDHNYLKAYQIFVNEQTSDAQYNAGNAAAYIGEYKKSINAYNKAIILNANNHDAIHNRDIIKKLIDKQYANKNSTNTSKNNEKNSKKYENNSSQNVDQDNQKPKNDVAQQFLKNNPLSPSLKKNMQKNNFDISSVKDQQKMSSKEQDKNKLKSNSLLSLEEKKQILRRISETPSGLLQEKFKRDYLIRHAIGEEGN